MIVNKFWNDGTKNRDYMVREAIMNSHQDIYDVYKKPSYNKVRAFNALKNEYMFNDTSILGIPCKTVKVPYNMHKLNNTMYLKYRGDIGVIRASCHFFTTCASFEDVETGDMYIIKETHCNTYMCKLTSNN